MLPQIIFTKYLIEKIPNTISTLKLINLTSSFWLKSFKKPQAVWIYSFRFLKFLSQKYFVRLINFKVEMV